jgi:DnaD/phage-associated family protein
VCARIERREIDVAVSPDKEPFLDSHQPPETEESSNIFTLYEENIGMLTPMIADELRDAEQLYSAELIEDAFREAVSRNKRKWKYIEAILKSWASEGREHGKPGRYSKEDPEKYFKGRYGHLVKR